LSATSIDSDSAIITWTPGTGGTSQIFYLDDNEDDVINGCPGNSCLVATQFGTAQNNYTTGDVLIDGTNYTYAIINFTSTTCTGSTYSTARSSFDPSFYTYAWFQVDGGNLHANSGGISSDIPPSCVGACTSSLITQSVAGATGLASFGSGGLNLGEGTLNEDGNEWQSQTLFQDNVTGYDYFSRILSDNPEGIGVWDGSLPSVTFPETKRVFKADAGLTTSGGDWLVSADEQIILLVDGDVLINNNIDVAEGGFLAIISSGNITVADSVTNVEGVFIADGVISSGSGLNQLIGEGIFVGWTGIELGRDLDTDNNRLNPAEIFIYRPDLQLNAYNYLLWLDLAWKEVAP
jgi:hypothetical protein